MAETLDKRTGKKTLMPLGEARQFFMRRALPGCADPPENLLKIDWSCGTMVFCGKSEADDVGSTPTTATGLTWEKDPGAVPSSKGR